MAEAKGEGGHPAGSARTQIESLIKEFIQEKNASIKFIPGKTKVQYSGPVVDEKEINALVGSILDGWFGVGKKAHEFEKKFAKAVSKKHGIVTNSGSSANLLAISALMSHNFDRRLSPGDEVIVPATLFPTVINPLLQNQLMPVIIDIDPETYNMDPELIEQAIGPKTKAIFVMHNLGNPCGMERIMEIAENHNLLVIEDNCDALGSVFKGKPSGSFGLMSTCSFYVAHHITMGEGGIVATDDDNLSEIIRSLRDWGRVCTCPVCVVAADPDARCPSRFKEKAEDLPEGYDIRYMYRELGYNLKPLEFQAAMGLVQLEKLEGFVEARRKNFEKLHDFFSNYSKHFTLPKASDGAEPSWFCFPLTVRPEAPFTRQEIIAWYEECNIETRLMFAGNIVRHPAYKDVEYRISGDLKHADRVVEGTFFLGVYPGIDDVKMAYILECSEKFLKEKSGQ